jgi:hypothetical protein
MKDRSWKSVLDELPPLSEDWYTKESAVVLVALSSGNLFTARLRNNGYGPSKWVLCGRDGYIADNVTHWQPLPAAPIG